MTRDVSPTNAPATSYAVRVWWSPTDSFVRQCGGAAGQAQLIADLSEQGRVLLNIKGWRPILRIEALTTVSTTVFERPERQL